MKVSSSSVTKASIIAIALIALIPVFVLKYVPASAATITELQRQQEELEKQAKIAEQQAQAKKTVAERAADKAEEAENQIKYLSSTISKTNSDITDVQSQINTKNQDIAQLESDLRKTKDQQDAVIRYLYITRLSLPDELRIFSNEPVSKRQSDEAQFEAAKKTLSSLYAKTNSQKLAIETSRNELVDQSERLKNLKTQQEEQKVGLADVRADQEALKENAEAAVATLEEKARQADAKIAKIEQQISAAVSAAIRAAANGKVTGALVGKRVTRGEIVGHMGSTGNSTGPHVHFETRINDTPVNPQPYVNNGTLSYPVSNFRVTQPFGYTSYAASGAYGGSIHTGIDLAGPMGQPVYAPANGTVILNQWYGGYGYAWAEQLDNGLVVLLGHMTGK